MRLLVQNSEFHVSQGRIRLSHLTAAAGRCSPKTMRRVVGGARVPDEIKEAFQGWNAPEVLIVAQDAAYNARGLFAAQLATFETQGGAVGAVSCVADGEDNTADMAIVCMDSDVASAEAQHDDVVDALRARGFRRIVLYGDGDSTCDATGVKLLQKAAAPELRVELKKLSETWLAPKYFPHHLDDKKRWFAYTGPQQLAMCKKFDEIMAASKIRLPRQQANLMLKDVVPDGWSRKQCNNTACCDTHCATPDTTQRGPLTPVVNRLVKVKTQDPTNYKATKTKTLSIKTIKTTKTIRKTNNPSRVATAQTHFLLACFDENSKTYTNGSGAKNSTKYMKNVRSEMEKVLTDDVRSAQQFYDLVEADLACFRSSGDTMPKKKRGGVKKGRLPDGFHRLNCAVRILKGIGVDEPSDPTDVSMVSLPAADQSAAESLCLLAGIA